MRTFGQLHKKPRHYEHGIDLGWLFCAWLHTAGAHDQYTGLILGLRPANERRRYKVTTSLIGWAQI